MPLPGSLAPASPAEGCLGSLQPSPPPGWLARPRKEPPKPSTARSVRPGNDDAAVGSTSRALAAVPTPTVGGMRAPVGCARTVRKGSGPAVVGALRWMLAVSMPTAPATGSAPRAPATAHPVTACARECASTGVIAVGPIARRPMVVVGAGPRRPARLRRVTAAVMVPSAVKGSRTITVAGVGVRVWRARPVPPVMLGSAREQGRAPRRAVMAAATGVAVMRGIARTSVAGVGSRARPAGRGNPATLGAVSVPRSVVVMRTARPGVGDVVPQAGRVPIPPSV